MQETTALEALCIDGLKAWAARGIDIRTDVKYCFSYRVRRTLAKFGLPFEKAKISARLSFWLKT